MPFNENWRSRRKTPVADAPDPAAAALGRAIMLARALKWREEWQAEMAARRAQTDRAAANGRAPRPAKQNGDGKFAAAVARNEFGRFYRSDKLQGAMTESLKGERRFRKSQKSRPD